MAAMATSSRDAYFKHRSRTRTTNWGDVETYQLIELWQSFRYDLQQTKKRRPIFEQMSRLMHGLGFKRDANEIQGRITNLAYLYRREGKLRLENPLRSPWKFWDNVHKVLRGEPPRRTPIQARQILPKPVSLPNTEARMIPPDTTLTVVNVPLPDVSVVKVENPSVPESTSAGDGRKSPPDESTAATEAWTDQSAACKKMLSLHHDCTCLILSGPLHYVTGLQHKQLNYLWKIEHFRGEHVASLMFC
uniref:Putative transcription factor gt-2 n=1 Tax=Hyalomma excavatum TaxID=257692 RepID=A0A131XH97_9ACAR